MFHIVESLSRCVKRVSEDAEGVNHRAIFVRPGAAETTERPEPRGFRAFRTRLAFA